VAGGIFVELSVKLSRFLIWHMVTILRGRCSTADASGSFFVAVAVLQRLRRKNGRSLFSHFHCSCFVAPAVFGENLTCARATLTSLCVCVGRCGAVLFSRSLAPPFHHFVRVRLLSLWRGVMLIWFARSFADWLIQFAYSLHCTFLVVQKCFVALLGLFWESTHTCGLHPDLFQTGSIPRNLCPFNGLATAIAIFHVQLTSLRRQYHPFAFPTQKP
jgi:hypothetical protein